MNKESAQAEHILIEVSKGIINIVGKSKDKDRLVNHVKEKLDLTAEEFETFLEEGFFDENGYEVYIEEVKDI